MTIEVVRFPGVFPSVGYTDFRKVYISESVTPRDQYATLHKHECGHIWLQHLGRMSSLREGEGKAFDFKRWNQAADLEIALYLYDQEDDDAIMQPRSWLARGIRRLDALKYTGCEFAEQFYKALADKPLEQDSHDGYANEDNETQLGDPVSISEAEIKELIQVARELMEESAQGMQRAWQEMDINAASKEFRPRPSLASEIDKCVGRPALARVKSYRRPDRREGDFFKKGVVSVPKTARLSVYVDRSGSFDANKTAAATTALAKVLQKYRGQVEKDAWFFNDSVLVKDPRSGGGGTNYGAVVKHIASTNPEVAVIITDDDPCDSSVSSILTSSKCKTRVIVFAVGASQTNIAKALGVPDFSSVY